MGQLPQQPQESGYNQRIWVKKETEQGVIAWPEASDLVLIKNDAEDFMQGRADVKDESKRGTTGEVLDTAGPWELGSYTIDTYVKPAGTLGVKPVAAPVYEAALGVETVTPGTSVVYSQPPERQTPVTYSILVQDNDRMTIHGGCGLEKLSVTVKATELVNMNVSGKFMNHATAGTTTIESIDGTSTPVEVLPLDTAGAHDKYMKGAKIILPVDDNGGAGYLITAVDSDANTITVTPGVPTSHEAGTIITGWSPGAVEVGEPVHGAYGIITANGGEITAKEGTVTVNVPLKEDEQKRDGEFPVCLKYDGEDTKECTVNGSFDSHGFNVAANTKTPNAVTIPAGQDAGKRIKFVMPAVQWQKPKTSGKDARETALTGKPKETGALHNALEIVFD
ncbi:MAG: hypothetical protein GY757_07830 [bacterium]|nr:hypothetical protein [bacterium]